MSDNTAIKFHEILKKLMKENGISGKQLATQIDVSESSLSTWLSGATFPTDPNVVLKCARVFNVTFFEMVYGEPELSLEQRQIKEKIQEISAGKFELVLRPIKD